MSMPHKHRGRGQAWEIIKIFGNENSIFSSREGERLHWLYNQLTLQENSWANTSLSHFTCITRRFVVTSNVRATLLAPEKKINR